MSSVYSSHIALLAQVLLKDEFATAFTSADEVYMTDIYSSGEDPIPGIDGTTIPNAIKEATGQDVNYVPSVDDLPEVLAKVVSTK